MSDDTVELSFSIPLDDDGFVRRECPECEREFKWHYSEENSEPVPDGGYFCPYCNVQSDANSWFTPAQLELATSVAARELVDPMMEDLADSVSGSGLSMKYEPGDRVDELSDEPNDMRRIDVSCHPKEPLKVLDSWSSGVHCMICGQVHE